jgi:hypothetical protein
MASLYDLVQFINYISQASISSINFKTLIPLNKTDLKAQNNDSLIWPAIIAVLSLLLFLTWKLTREMKQKQQ